MTDTYSMKTPLIVALAASSLAFTLCSHEGWEVTFENRLPFAVFIGTNNECWSDSVLQPGQHRSQVVAYKDDIDPPYTFIACNEAGDLVFTRTYTDPDLEDDKNFTVIIE